MAKILDGKIVRDRLAEDMIRQIVLYKNKPTMAIFQVGDREDSNAYIRQKKLFAEKIGATVIHKKFPDPADKTKLFGDIIAEIRKCNADTSIHGIILQIPLPVGLDKDALIEAIDPKKDVDGLTAANLKLQWENEAAGDILASRKHIHAAPTLHHGFAPATSRGILTLLDEYKIGISGKHVVVVGRSSLVGKPTALAFLDVTPRSPSPTNTQKIWPISPNKPTFWWWPSAIRNSSRPNM